jgi:hypothetical protein
MSLIPNSNNSFLQNITKKTTELSLKAARYARQTGKQRKITQQEKQELNLAKKRLTKPTSVSEVGALSKELMKIEQQNLSMVNSMAKQKSETDKAGVLSALTSAYYTPEMRAYNQRYVAGYRRGRGLFSRPRPIYRYRRVTYSVGQSLSGEGRSALESYFIANSRIKDTRAFMNMDGSKTWVSYGNPQSRYYQELYEDRVREYLVEKNRAISLMDDPRSLKNFGIDQKYTAEQRDYLKQILSNPVMEKYLYKNAYNDGKKYLAVGRLHQAIGMLLDPKAPDEIKQTGLQSLGYGSKINSPSMWGQVTQVNRAKIAQERFMQQMFRDTPQFTNITQLAKNEKGLLDTFLTKSKTKNLSGVDLSEYNKFVAEATKQFSLYKSSIKAYTDTLKNVGTQDNSAAYNYMYGTYNANPNIPIVAGGHGVGYGISGRLQAGSFNQQYKGYVDRAKNHATLLEKAYTNAYKALNKSLTQQLTANASLEKQKENIVTGIDKILNPEATKKTTTTKSQTQSDFIKQRMNRISVYKPSSQTGQRPI